MIKDVKLNEKDYPIFFSTFVLAQFGEKYELSAGALFSMLSDGLEQLTLMQVYELAYLAFKAGAKKANQEFPYKDAEEFSAILDEDSEWMEKVFASIAFFFTGPEEAAQKPAKKKQVAKTK